MSSPRPVDEVLALERVAALRISSKWVGLLIIVFFPLWGVLDHALVPDQSDQFATVRLGVMVPLLVLWGSLWSPRLSDRTAQVPALLLCVLPQMAVAWMAPRAGDALEVYLLGYTLIIYGVALLVVSGWRFAAIVLANGIVAMAVSFGLQRSLVDSRDVVIVAFYVTTAVAVAAMGRGYRMTVERREVTARLALEQEQARTLALVQELDERSRKDHLTGVDNRRAWDEALAKAFATARRAGHELSLLVVDVDRFKSINDRHGHAAGDEVLVAVAGVLLDRLRATDIVARIGGDEFAALLPDTGTAGAQDVAADVARHVRAATSVGGTAVTITVGSAGIVPTDRSASELMSRADDDLYERKARDDGDLYGRKAMSVTR